MNNKKYFFKSVAISVGVFSLLLGLTPHRAYALFESFDLENYHEVARPTFLLQTEHAGVLDKDTLVFAAFGSSGQVAYGLGNGVEARVNAAEATTINVGTTVNASATVKYHLFGGDNKYGVSIMGTAGGVNTLGATGAGYATYRADLPIAISTEPMIIAAVPYVSSNSSGVPGSTHEGANFGIGTFLDPHLALIAEAQIDISSGNTNAGYRGGVAILPTKNITIPIVLAVKGLSDQNLTLGLLAFYAAVGFRL